MPSQKRARALARAKHERQQARRAARRARRRKWSLTGVAIGAAVAVLVTLFITKRNDRTTASPETSSPSAGSTPTAPVPTPSGVSCSPATGKPQSKTYASAGDERLKPGAAVTFKTSCGSISVELAVKQAPQTSNAVAFLADNGWYNDNGCHRVTTSGIFVLQCGSPTLDGKGGPGFKIPDENLPKDGPNNYPAGTVAMANSGPGTAGSQLFFVYKDTTLGPNYSIVGKITSGLDVVRYVAAHGVKPGEANESDGPPQQPIVIESTTLRKK